MENEIYIIYLISFLTFIGVIILIEAGYLLIRSVREEGALKTNRRLKLLSAGDADRKEVLNLLRRDKLSSIGILNRVLSKIPRIRVVDRMLVQSGLTLTVTRYILLQLIFMVIITLALVYGADFHILIVLVIAIPLGLSLPAIYVSVKRKERLAKFTMQLPDTLDYIARSLRAGNPFSATLKGVANEMPDPTGTEFGVAFDEMNYGVELEDALHHLGKRSGCEEMNMFVTAVLIQRSTGGDLADVLNRIATVMRARSSVMREAAILSSEMRLSAIVLIALPIVVAAAIGIMNPDYLVVLIDNPVGQTVILIQLVLMAVGYLIMQRMINFHV
ncbi:MAG: type II secretion system F family protein [Pseudomonadota bacterium]|nr:type II secretion system F family protein [Pseudomonadota bacterium]